MTAAPRNPKTATEAVEGLDLSGKTFVVTGAYSGLGAATTRALADAGATVVVGGRNAATQQSFVSELVGDGVDPACIDGAASLDLAKLSSVRDFAQHILNSHGRIDCLINNAGVMNTPYGLTEDGFEIQMGTNVIGHFLLAKLLAQITARQVWLSSAAHALVGAPPGNHDLVNAPRIDFDAITTVDEHSYDGWARYQQSKLGDILLAKHFPVEFQGLAACAVHPGIVMTNVSRHLSIRSRLKFVLAMLRGAERPASPEQGARTQTMCAVIPGNELISGAYYAYGSVAEEAKAAKNADDAKRLYDYCNEKTQPFQT